MTKEDSIAGTMGIQHEVDCCVRLDLREDGLRILEAEKNQFGPTHRPVSLVMTPTGLVAYAEPDT